MPPDEGLALHDAAAARSRSTARCSRSAATAASRRSTSAPRPRDARPGAVHRRPPPRLGGEPAGLGVARARPRRPRRRQDGHAPVLPRTIHDAGLEGTVVAVVGDSPTVARGLGDAAGAPLHRRRPRRGAGPPRLRALDAARRAGRPLCIHDVFPDPADGGRPPYEIYLPALESGGSRRSRPSAPSGSSPPEARRRAVGRCGCRRSSGSAASDPTHDDAPMAAHRTRRQKPHASRAERGSPAHRTRPESTAMSALPRDEVRAVAAGSGGGIGSGVRDRPAVACERGARAASGAVGDDVGVYRSIRGGSRPWSTNRARGRGGAGEGVGGEHDARRRCRCERSPPGKWASSGKTVPVQ